ncbi:MAG: cytochrome P450 [Hyphomicrobiaceae bacterium]|nr:cytochrome P450 [Hyphomicrobiaceae bacterium]
MTALHAAEPALYPPRVTPPADPLPVWRFLPRFLVNPLRTLPERVYEEPLFAPPRFGGMMAWVTDPALVERILLDEHEAFPKSPIEARIFTSILGEGILTAEGQSWRWQRRIVAPLFRHQEIVALAPAMARVAGDIAGRWRTIAPGTLRRLDHDMTDATFDVLAATIFAGASEAEGTALKRHIGAYLEHTSWDVAFELLRIPAWVWHPGRPAMRHHARHLRATVAAILERERARGFAGGGLMAKLGTARDPQSGEPMSDDLVCSNLLTFAAAGHETTAKALAWTLYLLARAPGWQDRLREEVTSVAGAGPVEARHLEGLAVTRRVLKESMRLYPPAPVIGRMATKPVEIGSQHFQPGAMLVIPVWAIHRHRRLWEDPDRFDPDRFLPEREAVMQRAQYMPFGFGPRICIGMGFAMMEAAILLATFVRAARFEWDGRHRPEPVSRVTLRPKGGMPLRVTPL